MRSDAAVFGLALVLLGGCSAKESESALEKAQDPRPASAPVGKPSRPPPQFAAEAHESPAVESQESASGVPAQRLANREQAALVDDDGRTLWASPTGGAPLSLDYLPPGAELYLALRPADILACAEGAKILDALGPAGRWGKDRVEAIAGLSLTDMDQLIVAFYPQPVGPPKLAMVVRPTDGADTSGILQRWGRPEKVADGGKTYFRGTEWAYFVVPQGSPRTLVVTTPEDMPELLASEGPPLLRKEMEQLVRSSDQRRHVTLLAEPNTLFMAGKTALAGNLERLHDPLAWFFGDRVQAALLSFHFGDDFFAELRAYGSLDQDPQGLARQFRVRLDEVPGQVERYVAAVEPHAYDRAVLARFPEMIRTLAEYTRAGVEDRQAVLRCYLPGSAAHNLALGLELALAERPGEAGTGPAVARQEPTSSAAEALQKKISLAFDRETLETALDMLAQEIDAEIVILGKDLQAEGITRNQLFGLEERDKPAGEILRIMMKKASPEGKLVYVVRAQNPGGREAILITTRSAAAKRGDSLPAELISEPRPKR